MIENFFGLRNLQDFHAMEYFKQEYCGNGLIKAERKGLPPAIHRQQALSDA